MGQVAAAAIPLANWPMDAFLLCQILVTQVAEGCIFQRGCRGSLQKLGVISPVDVMTAGALTRRDRFMDGNTGGQRPVVAEKADSLVGRLHEFRLIRLVGQVAVEATA